MSWAGTRSASCEPGSDFESGAWKGGASVTKVTEPDRTCSYIWFGLVANRMYCYTGKHTPADNTGYPERKTV